MASDLPVETRPLDAAAGKPTRVRHGVVGFAVALSMVTYIDRVALSNSRKQVATALHLSDAQKASYKAFHEARFKAVEAATTKLCGNKPDVTTFEGRLAFHQSLLEDRLAAAKAENPKLITFYNSLDAEQKNKYDKILEDMARDGR